MCTFIFGTWLLTYSLCILPCMFKELWDYGNIKKVCVCVFSLGLRMVTPLVTCLVFCSGPWSPLFIFYINIQVQESSKKFLKKE